MDVRKELTKLEESMALGGDSQGADVVSAARRQINALQGEINRLQWLLDRVTPRRPS